MTTVGTARALADSRTLKPGPRFVDDHGDMVAMAMSRVPRTAVPHDAAAVRAFLERCSDRPAARGGAA